MCVFIISKFTLNLDVQMHFSEMAFASIEPIFYNLKLNETHQVIGVKFAQAARKGRRVFALCLYLE